MFNPLQIQQFKSIIKIAFKYTITIISCFALYLLCYMIELLIWENPKHEDIDTLIGILFLLFSPSIFYILLFSRNNISIHPIIVSLVVPVVLLVLSIINLKLLESIMLIGILALFTFISTVITMFFHFIYLLIFKT